MVKDNLRLCDFLLEILDLSSGELPVAVPIEGLYEVFRSVRRIVQLSPQYHDSLVKRDELFSSANSTRGNTTYYLGWFVCLIRLHGRN